MDGKCNFDVFKSHNCEKSVAILHMTFRHSILVMWSYLSDMLRWNVTLVRLSHVFSHMVGILSRPSCQNTNA